MSRPSPDTRISADALRALSQGEGQAAFSMDEITALVLPKRTLARRIATGALLTTDETDKALRLKRVADLSEAVFGDPIRAHRWMRKPKTAFDGRTPLEMLASERTARLVEDALHRIDDGMIG